MDIKSLTNLIKEIREIVPERRILLFGSSSLFGSFPDHPPVLIGVETTLDADFFLDPDDESFRASLLEKLGKERDYHLTHGFYGDFVDLRLADAFPQGWRDRLVPMPGFANVYALSPMDMAVSKVNASARSRIDRRFGRRPTDRGLKDINTLVALIKAGLLDYTELARQVRILDHAPALIVECSRVLDEVRDRAGIS